MTNPAKVKGTTFERDIKNKLNKHLKNGSFSRVAGSGAIGTVAHEPLLTGDLNGKIKGFSRKFKGECKVGYGGATQLTLKKEWLDKVIEQAEQAYSIPIFFGKFSGARKSDGVQEFIVLDFDTFVYMMNIVSDLQTELDIVYEKLQKG